MSSKEEPNAFIFKHAVNFLDMANRYLELEDTELDAAVMPCIVLYSVSIELMLKSLLPADKAVSRPDGSTITTEVKSAIAGHDLLELFNKLPLEIANNLKKKFNERSDNELKNILTKCKHDFVLARYAYEKGSKKVYYFSEVKEGANLLRESINDIYG